jgi:hypothetical protein
MKKSRNTVLYCKFERIVRELSTVHSKVEELADIVQGPPSMSQHPLQPSLLQVKSLLEQAAAILDKAEEDVFEEKQS